MRVPAIRSDELLEDTVLVSQSVSPHGQLLARARVQVARSETTEAAVAQTRIALLLEQILEAEAELVHALAGVSVDLREPSLHVLIRL